MSTLADLPDLVGFFSYSREDDDAFKGSLSALRDGIQRELSAQLGRSKTTFRLWQDQAAIAPGKLWESEIKAAVDQSVFFIPIVTPRSVNSKYCKFEFESFSAREKAIGRSDLVFPILYISVAGLESEAKWRDDLVLSTIGRRQYVDWRPLRHLDAQTTAVREQIERFCRNIVEALNEPWISPEERRRMEETEARRQAEEEARRLEAEARQRADEEEARRRAEAAARQKAEEQARRLEAETRQRATEEAERGRVDAEARQRAEERRRHEAEAERKAEQERAFADAKRADAVAALDAFLAGHPDSPHRSEASTLRAALAARDEAFKAAMASDDLAVLKMFLESNPNGALARQVRGRLRRLEPRSWSRTLPWVAGLLGVALLGSVGLWVGREPPSAPEAAAQLPVVSAQPAPPAATPAPVITLGDDLETCKSGSGDKVVAACSRVIVSAGVVSPDDLGRAYVNRGWGYIVQADLDRAKADFDEAIRLNPTDYWAFNGRAYMYMQKRYYERATVDANEAIRLNSKIAIFFGTRGQIYYAKWDYDRALADYNQAIKLDATDAMTFADRGNAYYGKQSYDRAIADYNQAIKLDPKAASAFNARGASYHRKQNYDRAMADFTEAIRTDPRFGLAYLNRGLSYFYSGAPAKAWADVSQASEIDPKSATYALWVEIVGRRTNASSRLTAASREIDMTEWPAPLIRMFLGQTTSADVLAAANDPDANKKKGQICDANFYSGELALLESARDEAIRRFRLAVADCPRIFIEWDAANAELKALGATR